jgi:hypothetical protein
MEGRRKDSVKKGTQQCPSMSKGGMRKKQKRKHNSKE